MIHDHSVCLMGVLSKHMKHEFYQLIYILRQFFLEKDI